MVYETIGRRFESCWVHQICQKNVAILLQDLEEVPSFFLIGFFRNSLK